MLISSSNLLGTLTICLLLTWWGVECAKVGVCDTCLATNYVACLDENHFSVCHDDSPSSTIVTCPTGRVCTNDLQICRLTTDGFTPICYEENCGKCDLESNSVFTCLDRTTYAYCYGSTTLSPNAVRSCPEGYVCNTYSKDICVPAETNQPSCLIAPSTPAPPTTTEAPRDANTICREIGKTGYFKSDDPTCRQYVYCYLLSGQYIGWSYYCNGFFNAATGKCQAERPADCRMPLKLTNIREQIIRD